MSQYNELYQQVILEHNKSPRNFKPLEGATCLAYGKNPLCGDEYAIYANINDAGEIESVTFQGDGCAISKASASLMTVNVKGKSKAEAEQLKTEFQKMLTKELNVEAEAHHLGRLTIFEGVKEYPARVKCATLCWHTLVAALSGQSEVTTE
jgi:nitrogen fixation protein NifU and related proteins